MSNPTVQLALISNVWIKLMKFNFAGDIMEGHKHVFDHPTLLSIGSVEVDVEGVKTTFKAPHIIFIQKGRLHTITALEDGTVAACIHAIRDGDGVDDIVDPAMIPKGINQEDIFKTLGVKPLTRSNNDY